MKRNSTYSQYFKWGLLIVALAGFTFAIPAVNASKSKPLSQSQQEISQQVSSFARVPSGTAQEKTKANTILPSNRYGVEVADYAEITYTLDPLDLNAIRPEAANQIGVGRVVGISSTAIGKLIVNQDGSKIRVFAIKSPGAHGIRIHFEDFDLPAGDEVYLYNATPDSFVAGPYIEQGSFGNKEFWSNTIDGDTVIIEHHIKNDERSIYLSAISHIYTGDEKEAITPNVLGCHVDASCSNESEKSAVGRYRYTKSSGSSFVCTGTLLDDTRHDRIPYFLTANHCISTVTEAQSVEVYWFYRTTSCNSGVVSSSWVRSLPQGANLLATDYNIDSTLLRITGSIPSAAVFSAWDSTPRATSTSVFGLHHPGGGIPPSTESYLRKSSGQISGTKASCNGSTGLLSGYQVNWTSGITEGGSSGSGLWYTANGRNYLIGVLSCGPQNPSCTATRLSLYGKFSSFYPLIRVYLDPSGGCQYSLSPASQSFSTTGGVGSVSVIASSGCPWAASSNSFWITITSGSSGSGNGVVNYSVATNASTSSRTGTITIAGQTFTVTQTGVSCSYSLTFTNQSFSANGGAGSVGVNASTGCSWTTVSNVSFITITSGGSGSGNGTIFYSVAPNTGAARTGTMNIAGQTFTVSQSAGSGSCSYSLSPTSQSISADGGSRSVSVTTSAGCNWTASSSVFWISITSGNSGSGNGTVNYSVAVNSGTARTSMMTIAGQTFTVSQAAPSPPPGGGNNAPVITRLAADLRGDVLTLTGTVTDADGDMRQAQMFALDSAGTVVGQTEPFNLDFGILIATDFRIEISALNSSPEAIIARLIVMDSRSNRSVPANADFSHADAGGPFLSKPSYNDELMTIKGSGFTGFLQLEINREVVAPPLRIKAKGGGTKLKISGSGVELNLFRGANRIRIINNGLRSNIFVLFL